MAWQTWLQRVGGQLLCVKHSERWQWPMLPGASNISLCAWNIGEMWRRLLWYLMAALFLWIFTVCIKRVTVVRLVILMAWQRLVMATPFHWTFTVGINCWWDMAETGGPVGNTISVYLLFCAYSMGGETRRCLQLYVTLVICGFPYVVNKLQNQVIASCTLCACTNTTQA